MSTQPSVGMPILFFAAGAVAPLAGVIAGINSDGRVNLSLFDSNGQSMARQGVPFTDEPSAAGDYVVGNLGGDSTAAVEAHQAAMKAAFHGVPVPRDDKPSDKPAAPDGDFTSAAHAADNVQLAGSGGPFDPANTAKAHMTVHQTQESQSAGNPTTGGVTPKLSAENMHVLSERDRETAQAIVNAKSDDEKVRLASGGTGAATRGTAQAIVDHAAGKKAPETPAAVAAAAIPAGQANEEAGRLQRDAERSKEAQRRSKEITKERAKDPLATADAVQIADAAAKSLEKANADAAAQNKRAAAAKTTPQKRPASKPEAKKAPAKKAGKKSR